MSGQVFRITELNPKLEMEIAGLLESTGLLERYRAGGNLFGVFDSGGSLSGIAGSKEFETECLLQFVAVREDERGEGIGTTLVGRVLAASVSGGCERVWVLAVPGCEGYFGRFGFEPVASDRLPETIRNLQDMSGVEIASTRVMSLEEMEELKEIAESSHASLDNLVEEGRISSETATRVKASLEEIINHIESPESD